MNKTRLLTTSLLAAGAASMALPGAASAQRIDKIVAFGDSYADDGNAFEFAGIDPISTGAFPTGRFSGGSNYIDTLSALLNAPVENFAIGGAEADGDNRNAGLPGFGFQIGAYLAGGDIPPAYPAVSGTFDANDLVAINIGGNDARSYQLDGGDVAGADAAAQISANAAVAGVNALVAAGAQNISWLYGDAGALPESELVGGVEVRSAFSAAYNAATLPALGQLASQGVMVHALDISLVGQQAVENLSDFGLIAESCPTDTSCIVDQTFANQHLFYFDQLHLTSRGFEILGQYVAAQLQAPLTLSASSDMALDNARHFGRVMSARVDGTSPRDGDMAEGLKIFAGADAYSRNVDMTMVQDAMEIRSFGVHGGLEYGFGNGVVGLIGRYSTPSADYVGDAAQAEASSIQLGAFAGYALGPLFLQAYAGWGSDDHEIERRGIIDALEREADTDGDHFLIGGKAGYLFPTGVLRVGPVVSIDYASADVDGYTESGDDALNLIVEDIDYSSLRGAIGIEARGDFEGEGVQLRPYGSLVLEKELDADGRTFRFAQTTSPGIVNSWDVGETDDSVYARLTAGMSAQLFSTVRLDVAGNTTFSKDDGNETGGSVALSLAF